jgi:mannose-6-phosphate isomerase-like protein (cupin superfamily)
MESIERIAHNEQVLCILIRASLLPDQTTFMTPPEYKQQVGFVVYPKGGEITRHTHVSLQRHLVGTSEVLIVKKGRCLIDIYNDAHDLIASRELNEGDLMLMVGGGHGFRMLEDTILLEVKQGPYTGLDEKERF